MISLDHQELCSAANVQKQRNDCNGPSLNVRSEYWSTTLNEVSYGFLSGSTGAVAIRAAGAPSRRDSNPSQAWKKLIE